jgi:hypothetical protein
MYNKDNKELKRDYVAIATYGWKQWGTSVPTVKLVVNSYGQSVEQNLSIEEVGQVIEMLQTALAEALAAEDHSPSSEPWDEMPF